MFAKLRESFLKNYYSSFQGAPERPPLDKHDFVILPEVLQMGQIISSLEHGITQFNMEVLEECEYLNRSPEDTKLLQESVHIYPSDIPHIAEKILAFCIHSRKKDETLFVHRDKDNIWHPPLSFAEPTLHNSILLTKTSQELGCVYILIKSRLRYSNPLHRSLMQFRLFFEVIKPAALFLKLSTSNGSLLYATRVETWTRTSEMQESPCSRRDKNRAMRSESQADRTSQFFISHYFLPGYHPIRAPDNYGMICYRHYSGFPMDKARILFLSNGYLAKKFGNTLKFKTNLLFLYLAELRRIFERKRFWISDLSAANTFLRFCPNGTLQLQIKYTENIEDLAYSAFKKPPGVFCFVMAAERLKNLLWKIRNTHRHGELSQMDFEYLRIQLIVEILLMCLMISGWPHILDVQGAFDYPEFRPDQNFVNILVTPAVQDTKIQVERIGISDKRVEFFFTQAFLSIGGRICQSTIKSLTFKEFLNILYAIEWPRDPSMPDVRQALPWPEACTQEWIDMFGDVVDNFWIPVHPQSCCPQYVQK